MFFKYRMHQKLNYVNVFDTRSEKYDQDTLELIQTKLITKIYAAFDIRDLTMFTFRIIQISI